MKLKIILFATLLLLVQISKAETPTSLTLDKLVKDNYKLMSGNDISEMLLGKKIILKDLLSEAVYEVKIHKNGTTEKKQIKSKNPKMLTNVDYHARAALLDGAAKFSVSANKIITSDGVRTYNSSLYRKGDNIFGVRDIDNNEVNFQIVIGNHSNKK
ncbi:hypothetical protein MNBD_GAMMA08-1698 [hydrothermal vent metagenome]|uniref:Uncharacterized protein n=1 Tax=hydrothermal vent metagenome TaxID=652676 RepID=A0A3B0XS00_9ZZZZ